MKGRVTYHRECELPSFTVLFSLTSAGKDGVILYNTGSANLTLKSEGPGWWSNGEVCLLCWVGLNYLLNWYAACCCLLITKTGGSTKWLVCECFSTSWLEKWTSVEAWDQSTPPPTPFCLMRMTHHWQWQITTYTAWLLQQSFSFFWRGTQLTSSFLWQEEDIMYVSKQVGCHRSNFLD